MPESVPGLSVLNGRTPGTAFRQMSELLEREAERIALALHDEAGNLLTPLHLKLAAAEQQAPDYCLPCFVEIRALLDCVEAQLRRLSHELRPPLLDDFGLIPAIEFLIRGISQRAKLPINLKNSVAGRFPRAFEMAVYRTVQEGLTNVIRHARATAATVELRMEGRMLVCTVRDDGIGFDPASGAASGLGLRGLRLRMAALEGQLAVRSSPGSGTELAIYVPVQ